MDSVKSRSKKISNISIELSDEDGAIRLKKSKLKQEKPDSEMVKEFWEADPKTLFGEDYIAPVRGIKVSTLQNERWSGKGIPFRKISGRVLYQKIDVIAFLESHELVTSTSEYVKNENILAGEVNA